MIYLGQKMGRAFERIMDHLDILAKGAANSSLIIERKQPQNIYIQNLYINQLKQENIELRKRVEQLERALLKD